jgi:hypothetical protein
MILKQAVFSLAETLDIPRIAYMLQLYSSKMILQKINVQYQ